MSESRIDSGDISVVVQGVIDAHLTPLCLRGIRKSLPNAEIILSTWKGASIEGLDFDVLVLSDDPGEHKIADYDLKVEYKRNLPRQLLTTQRGIEKAQKLYILKIRSDIILNDSEFLQHYNTYCDFEEKYRAFNSRILTTNYYTKHSYRSEWLFHPSDWIAFGARDDINLLYDIPIPLDPIENNFFFVDNENIPKTKGECRYSARYCSEQYIFVNCLRKKSYFGFHDCADVTDQLRHESEQYLVNNFVVLDYGSQFNISFLKFDPDSGRHIERINNNGKLLRDIYSFSEWEALYNKCCRRPDLGQEKKIDMGDISVVVQGPIDAQCTSLCLQNIRKFFPGSEIILSTWKGSEVEGLDFDVLVFSDDPGEQKIIVYDAKTKYAGNLSRQLCSTQSGLKLANRSYILKIRSDLVINDGDFLQYYNMYCDYEEKYRVFDSRILITNYYTRHSYRSHYLFHPSDWIAFGSREDIKLLYDIPIPADPIENSTFFMDNENIPKVDGKYRRSLRYTPEQYIFVNCLRKKSYFGFHDCTDITDQFRYESEQYLLNNFVVLDYGSQFNVSFLKYDPDRHISHIKGNRGHSMNIYDFSEWEALYNKCCWQRTSDEGKGG